MSKLFLGKIFFNEHQEMRERIKVMRSILLVCIFLTNNSGHVLLLRYVKVKHIVLMMKFLKVSICFITAFPKKAVHLQACPVCFKCACRQGLKLTPGHLPNVKIGVGE